jgi:hypothetical protein
MIPELIYIIAAVLFLFMFILSSGIYPRWSTKNTNKKSLMIPVSAGELFDKIAILNIKKDKINDGDKLQIIEKELKILEEIKTDFIGIPMNFEFNGLYEELHDLNLRLWDAEEMFRIKDEKKEYDEEFVKCAKLDISLNDKRFVVKRRINDFFDSQIKEVKSYKESILNRIT